MSLKKSLGPVSLMFTAVSGILGSAWFFGPFYVAQLAGPSGIVAWVLGALATMVIAMTFAELVCLFPISGGNARFAQFSHGTLAGFIFSWTLWIGYAAVAPVETMGVLQYLSAIFPSLLQNKASGNVLSVEGYWIAAVILFLMCWLNFFSIKWLSYYNAVIVWVKMIVPLIVAITLITLAFHWHHFTMAGFAPGGFKGIASAISVGGVIFSFAGYAPAIVLAGEVKNPQKVIPLVLIGALVICLAIYLILQMAFIGSINPDHLTHGWLHLDFAGDASPFVAIAAEYHLKWMRDLVLLAAIVAPLGTALIFVATSARVAMAMAQNSHGPSLFAKLNHRGVPALAVSLNFVIGLVLFFPSPTWQSMMGFLVSVFVVCYAVGPICVMAFRQQLPDRERRFKLPWAPLWCYVAFTLTSLIIYWTGWHIILHLCIAIVVGFVAFALYRIFARHNATMPELNIRNGIWLLVYIAGIMGLSYAGSYGGGHGWITDRWDALVVAVFALLIYVWAYYSRLKVVECP